MDLYQVCSKWPNAEVNPGSWADAKNHLLQNMFMLHIKLKGMKHAVTWGGVKKSTFFFFECSHVAYQINRNDAYIEQSWTALKFYTPSTPVEKQTVKAFFSEVGHVAYQIKKKEAKSIMQVKSLIVCTL